MAILVDWKANRIDALTDVYALDPQTLDIRYVPGLACPRAALVSCSDTSSTCT